MKLPKHLCAIALIAALALTCAFSSSAFARSGKAAYYKKDSRFVTASRYEPRGSVLLVTNPETGKSIKVTVIDRGPWNGNRVLDLSTGAFKALYGSLRRGVGPVTYKVLKRGGK